MKSSALAPALVILLLTSTAKAQRVDYGPFTGCDFTSFYDGVSLTDRAALHALLRDTHRQFVPYSSTSPDTWDALSVLDGDGSGNVRLIYAGMSVPANSYPDVWNREHTWPKSLGVGYSDTDKDYTDLHMLRPSDTNVNSARSNLYYGACGTARPSSECQVPAHPEAAADTQKDAATFLPPVEKRGDLARAIFYMAMRYDGEDDSDAADLEVSDCPDAEAPNKMGYLSQLLQWHEDDDVDASELARNDAVCTNWQGNRNPFVDYPFLVSIHFGFPRELLGDGLGYNCSTSNSSPVVAPTSTPTISHAPSPAPQFTTLAPTSSDATDNSLCRGMAAGSVAVTGFKSDNNAAGLDEVVLVALEDLLAGAELYMTDNAWTGSFFRTNEGTKKLAIPTGGIVAGSIFGFGSAALTQSSSWQNAGGSFALSSSGDSISLYCLDGNSAPRHIYALTYSNGWAPENTNEATFGSTQSARPGSLPLNCALALSHMDNYRYNGTQSGSQSELLDAISTSSNWLSSNDGGSFDIMISSNMSFNVRSAPTISPTKKPEEIKTKSKKRGKKKSKKEGKTKGKKEGKTKGKKEGKKKGKKEGKKK